MSIRVFYPIHIDRWTNPIATLAREVATRAHGIDFYTFSGPTSEEDIMLNARFWANPHIHRLTIPGIFAAARRCDILHQFYMTDTSRAISFFVRRWQPRCIHVFTANLQPYPRSNKLERYARAVYSADIVVAVSEAVANSISQMFNRPVDAIIPNGVDTSFFTPQASANADISSGTLKAYVLYCASLEKRKRPDIFLKLAEQMPELDFIMIGRSTNESSRYLHAISQIKNVRYLGLCHRSEVRDLMAGALALVFPSEWEGLPLTVLEASAMGIPVLAQPKSSLPEVVVEDITGWLIPDTELAAWQERIKEILGWSIERRQRFAKTARQFVSQRYSWDSVAEQYQELYYRLIS